MPSRIASRVAQRYLIARGLTVGQTYQNPKVRVHRFSELIQVTDLTNAGKRGKKVPEMSVSLTFNYEGDKPAWFERTSQAFLEYARSADPYGKMKAFIKDLQVDYPDDIRLSEEELKGIDVEPYGQVFEFKVPLDDNKSSLEILSSPTSFRVTNHAWMTRPNNKGGFIQDTSYHPVKKKDAVIFYGWMSDNASKLKNMKSMDDVRKLWNTLQVKYDYH